MHLPEHPKDVQHGLVNAVCGEVAKSGKERLVLEFKRPRHRSQQVDLELVGQLECPGDLRSGVTRVHRPVPVGVLRVGTHRTRGTAFGIRFANHDGRVAQLRVRRDDLKTVRDGLELIADAHPHVAFDDPRRSLGVKRHEIERRSDLAGGMVGAAEAVLDEIPENLLRPRTIRSRDFGPADPGLRQRTFEAVSGEVVQLLKLLRCTAPIPDVRFVPHLPIPGRNLSPAIALDCVPRPLIHQLSPLRVIGRWVGPTRVDAVVLDARRPLVLIRVRLRRERLRHEANLDERLHLALDVRVENPVDDRPVVHGTAIRVFRVRVRRSPFQRRRSIARRQQVVNSDVHGNRAQRGELGQQPPPVRHVGVVRFVVTEEGPHRRHRAASGRCIDVNRHLRISVLSETGPRRHPGNQNARDDGGERGGNPHILALLQDAEGKHGL